MPRRLAKCLAAALMIQPLAAQANDTTDRIWKSTCAPCHGADGKGRTVQGKRMTLADFTDPAWGKGTTDAKIRAAIEKGRKEVTDGVVRTMPAYGNKLQPPDVDGLVAFVRTLSATAPERGTKPRPRRAPPP